jgi:hypothetical protein
MSRSFLGRTNDGSSATRQLDVFLTASLGCLPPARNVHSRGSQRSANRALRVPMWALD